ncbi:MAG: hypothetical protein AB7F36_15380, partial [Reyranellaceae bacterium]
LPGQGIAVASVAFLIGSRRRRIEGGHSCVPETPLGRLLAGAVYMAKSLVKTKAILATRQI